MADLIRALAAGLASEAITHEELLGHVRNGASKPQKKQGIVDGWYVDASEDAAEDKWIFEAARATGVSGWPDGEHSCEALGPRIQGNPLKLEARDRAQLVIAAYDAGLARR